MVDENPYKPLSDAVAEPRARNQRLIKVRLASAFAIVWPLVLFFGLPAFPSSERAIESFGFQLKVGTSILTGLTIYIHVKWVWNQRRIVSFLCLFILAMTQTMIWLIF